MTENTKIKIYVREIVEDLESDTYVEDSGDDQEPNETIFTSGQFLKNPLTGK